MTILLCQYYLDISSFHTQAGIASFANPDRLLIALEPEAASIFCRKLRIRDCVIEDDLKARAGDDSLISEDFQGKTLFY